MRLDAINRIKSILEEEYISIILKKYFDLKGIENLDAHIYPPSLQDMQHSIPQLAEKLEVVPSVDKINTMEGTVQLRWNLFALGINRMHLGDTVHKSLSEIRSANIVPPQGTPIKMVTTPNKIIKFLVRVLHDNKEIVNPSVTAVPAVSATTARPRIGPTWSGGYYEKNRPVL